MSNFLFGYYGIGLRSLNAARIGMQIAGNNIANATTPGYARRRLELTSGFPIRFGGQLFDQGVEVATIRRMEDRFLQASLERENGRLGYWNQRLSGLHDVESLFGSLDGPSILSAYGDFSGSFAELAAQPEDPALRRNAVSTAETLTRQIRETYRDLQLQRQSKNREVVATVTEINRLGVRLSELNDDIHAEEADGTVAAALRDDRARVVEELSTLSGGSASAAENGKVTFALAGGPTIVTSEHAIALTATGGPKAKVLAGDGSNITSGLKEGKLGALIGLRDDDLQDKLADLNALAADLITRANALVTSGQDLDGNPGGPLFEPDPPGIGSALSIAVASDVADDPRKLAISASGAAGDGSLAIELSELLVTNSGGLGFRTPETFLAELLGGLGSDIVEADVASTVSGNAVESLLARREAVSGVSLDEEAVELIRHQRAFEASARFIQVLNEITEIAVNLG